MYFKVRCIREQVRTVISLVTFLLPLSLLISLLRPFLERLLGLQLDAWPNSLFTWAGGVILGLILGIPLQFYKVYEFTDREIHVQWWYGNWGFYFNWLLQRSAQHRHRPEPTHSALDLQQQTECH